MCSLGHHDEQLPSPARAARRRIASRATRAGSFAGPAQPSPQRKRVSRQDREAARKRVHDDLAFSRAQACARVPDDVEQLHMEFEQLAPGADMLPEYQIAPMRDRHGREIDPGSLYYSSARES